jgi:beta-glucosidase
MSEVLPSFPGNFLFGAATAAYQIEGAAGEDGRGPSVWDTFSHTPGKTRDGDTGDVACDHYHRWQEDLDLLAGLGVGGYRFSVSWSRVQPEGSGAINPAGIAFYDRLVDGLLERGIAPCPTLFHWDLPQRLEDGGGWLTRDTAQRFADYAAVMAEALGDRVAKWITLNEPFVHTVFGYALGVHAPGRDLLTGSFPAAHHQLLGHGLAVRALRAAGVSGDVGITNNFSPSHPAGDDPRDAVAADRFDVWQNRWFTDPVLLGSYPEGLADIVGSLEAVRDADLDVISTPLDFLGVNYYNPSAVAAGPPPLGFEYRDHPAEEHTSFGWPVVPESLHELLVLLRDRYAAALPPIFITENGASYDDEPDAAGVVDDPRRVAFLDGHLRAVARAIDDGVDVRGYFVWSLLDNFEWAEGYSKRFGIVHVDFTTQQRTTKTSYGWYRDVVAGSARTGGAPGT